VINELRKVEYLLYVLFAVSVFTLTIKFLVPSKVYFVVTGSGVNIYEVHELYTVGDVLTIALAVSTASVTGTLILTGRGGRNTSNKVKTSEKVNNDVIKYWESMRSELVGIEARIIEELLKAGGALYQSELQEILGIPKSTLSMELTKLEARGAVIRVKRGLRNLVVLTKPKV